MAEGVNGRLVKGINGAVKGKRKCVVGAGKTAEKTFAEGGIDGRGGY